MLFRCNDTRKQLQAPYRVKNRRNVGVYMIDIHTEIEVRRKHLDVIKQEIREKLLHIGADEQQINEILTLAVFMHALGYFYSEKDSVIKELQQRGANEITLENRQH